ncbi:hypothetical protein ABPG77_009740 [Micractinium sp. CCAP 211/92]
MKGRDLPLGDELLALVLAKLRPADLGAAEGACRRWREVAAQHSLWRRHAAEADAPEQGQDGKSDKQRFLEAQWARLLSRPEEFVRTVRPERRAHAAAVTSLSALPGAGLLASASADRTVRLWALPARGALRPSLLCTVQHPAGVLWVHLLSPELCASATAAAVFVWRIEPAPAGAAGSAPVSGSNCDNSGTLSPSGRQLRLLRRVAVDGGGGSRPLLQCACAWDQFCAVGCADGTVRVLDLFSGACSKLLRLHGSRGVAALQAVRGPGGADLFVSGGSDGRLLITDVASGLTLAEAVAPRGEADVRLACLALDPVSGLLLAGGSEAACRILHRWSAGQHLRGLPSPAQRLDMARNAQLPALPALRRLPGAPFTSLVVPAVSRGGHFFAGDTQGLVSVTSTQSAQEALSFGLPAQAGSSAAAVAAVGPQHAPADPLRLAALTEAPRVLEAARQTVPPTAFRSFVATLLSECSNCTLAGTPITLKCVITCTTIFDCPGISRAHLLAFQRQIWPRHATIAQLEQYSGILPAPSLLRDMDPKLRQLVEVVFAQESEWVRVAVLQHFLDTCGKELIAAPYRIEVLLAGERPSRTIPDDPRLHQLLRRLYAEVHAELRRQGYVVKMRELPPATPPASASRQQACSSGRSDEGSPAAAATAAS